MFFFLVKPLFVLAFVALLVRAGMHAQQLVDEGVSPWTADGVEEVGARMRADLDGLRRVAS